jgi:hypothetical protein
MRVRLHIERVVLDGLPVSEGAGPHVQAALEVELARLVAAGGLSPAVQGGMVVPAIQGGDIRMKTGGGPAELGRQIAGAVYGGIVR